MKKSTPPLPQADADRVFSMSDGVAKELLTLPRCPECGGKGTIKPFLHDLECPRCEGAGLDVSDPLSVIKLQKELLAKAKAVIVHQRQSLYRLTVGDEQATKDSMDKFYAASKRID